MVSDVPDLARDDIENLWLTRCLTATLSTHSLLLGTSVKY